MRAQATAEQHLSRGELGKVVLARQYRVQGRAETLRCVEWAADTLAHLGGAELLLAAASAIDEIDGWWHV